MILAASIAEVDFEDIRYMPGMKTKARHLLVSAIYSLGIVLMTPAGVKAMPMTYSFEYEFWPGSMLSGVFQGELQGDGDTIQISELNVVKYSALPDLVFHTELVDGFNVVSFSGSSISLLSQFPAPNRGVFSIRAGPFNQVFAVVGFTGDVGDATDVTNVEFEPFSRSTWAVRLEPSLVSTPGTMVLMAVGLCLGLLRRGSA